MRTFTNFFLSLFLLSGLVIAQSNHTITIDGTNDFDDTNEKFSTSSSGYYAYFTWDANNIYFAISGIDVDMDGKVSFIYIDTDPNGSNGTTSTITWSVTHTLPFNADWAFAYKVQTNDDYWNLRKYDGSSWQADQDYYGSVSLGTDYLEVSIPRSDIDNPDEIKIVIFMQDDDGGWTFSAAPDSAITDGSGSKTFEHYYGYTLSEGYNPNDERAYDNILGTNKAYLSFDGNDDYVRLDDNLTLDLLNSQSEYTLEGWIYINNWHDNMAIYSRWSRFIFYLRTNGQLALFVETSNGWKRNYSVSNAITTGEWLHVAVIRSNSNGIKFYVNGVDKSAGTYSGYDMLGNSDDDHFYIGYAGSLVGTSQDGDVNFTNFDGWIDEIRCKKGAEDPTNLNYNKYDIEYESDANTAVLFHFDEGSGNHTTKDFASGNNARLGSTVEGDDAEPTWESDVSGLPLPVELTSFTANVNGSTVNLIWETATEVNNYGFEVERTTENSDWQKIGFVEGTGNSNSPKEYSFTDIVGKSGNYSYRLKQIDINGEYKYSDVVEVSVGLPTKFELKQNYPNPFNPTTNIKYSIAKKSRVMLKIYDMLGREVATLVNKEQTPGNYAVEFGASRLSSGVYFYTLKAGEFTATKKMILMK